MLRPPPPPQEDRRVEETSRDGFTLPYVGIRRMYTGDFSRGTGSNIQTHAELETEL